MADKVYCTDCQYCIKEFNDKYNKCSNAIGNYAGRSEFTFCQHINKDGDCRDFKQKPKRRSFWQWLQWRKNKCYIQ